MPARRTKEKKSDTHTDTSRMALEEKVKVLEERLETQRREFEAVNRSHRRLLLRDHILERVVHMLNQPERPVDNLQGILELCLEAIPSEAGSILLHDPENDELYFSVASGPVARGIKELRLPVGQGIAGACFQGREVIAVSDVDKDPRFHRAISRALGFQARSLLAVPVVHRGQTIGVIEILNRQEGDHFTSPEVESIQLLARVAAGLLGTWQRLSGSGGV